MSGTNPGCANNIGSLAQEGQLSVRGVHLLFQPQGTYVVGRAPLSAPVLVQRRLPGATREKVPRAQGNQLSDQTGSSGTLQVILAKFAVRARKMGVESVRGVYDLSSLIATQAQGFVDPLLLLLFQAR